MTDGSSSEQIVAAVAAFGLPGSALELPHQVLDDGRWLHVLHRVGAERLSGHLVAALDAGGLPATVAQRDQAVELHEVQLGQALLLERRLLEVTAALAAEGIDCRALKGSPVAHLAYPDPSLRLFGDVDVLVGSARFDDAVELLTAGRYRRLTARLRAGFDRRFGKGVTLVDADGFEVDLHRTFVPGYFGLSIDLDELFASPRDYPVGGASIPALGPDEQLLQACYHVSLGHVQRLVPLRDVAQMILFTAADTGRVLDLARRWHGRAVVAHAVRRTWDAFQIADAVPLSAWARAYEVERRDAKLLTTYQGKGRRERGRVLATLGVIDGWSDQLSYLRALALPERGFLDQQGISRLGWVRGVRRGARPWMP